MRWLLIWRWVNHWSSRDAWEKGGRWWLWMFRNRKERWKSWICIIKGWKASLLKLMGSQPAQLSIRTAVSIRLKLTRKEGSSRTRPCTRKKASTQIRIRQPLWSQPCIQTPKSTPKEHRLLIARAPLISETRCARKRRSLPIRIRNSLRMWLINSRLLGSWYCLRGILCRRWEASYCRAIRMVRRLMRRWWESCLGIIILFMRRIRGSSRESRLCRICRWRRRIRRIREERGIFR